MILLIEFMKLKMLTTMSMIKLTMILSFLFSSYGLLDYQPIIPETIIIKWVDEIKLICDIPLTESWSKEMKFKYRKQIEKKLKYYKTKKLCQY